MSWLVDTNVISEGRKLRANPFVTQWLDIPDQSALHLSVVTFAEIRWGIETQTDPVFRAELDLWLSNIVSPAWGGRLLPVDEAVLLQSRRILRLLKAENRTIDYTDLLLAATAKVHCLAVLTRNVRDFEACGVAVLDPWKQPPDQAP